MNVVDLIKMAKTQSELSDIVDNAAERLNLELNNSMPWWEQADFYEDEAKKEVIQPSERTSMLEMVEILRSAESRWHELS